MEKRIMNVYFDSNLLPYKDKECQVHFPVVGNTFAGGSLATEIRFYVDNIGGYENITWLVNSKRPDGSNAYQKLTVGEEDAKKYVYFLLSSYYTQYVGDLYLTLNGYEGGAEPELDDTDPENPIWTISGTPIVQATGSIKLSIAYAVQMPSDYGEVPMISVQEALAIVNQKADKTYVDNQDQAIYTYVDGKVEILETAIDGKVDKKTTSGLRVYAHNGNTETEISVTQAPLPTLIPRYDNGARLSANAPQFSTHVANKGYVDFKELDLKDLINKAGHTLSLVQNTQTYDYVIQLKDKSGSVISSIDIDLPLEQIITSGYYDEEEKAIVLVLDNGSEVSIPVGDLVEGLIDQETLTQELHDYVKDVEITSIKTVNEVLTEIGGLNHIFSFDLMGIKYLGLFVQGENNTADLELWSESGTSKVVNIDTTQLFRDEIANAVADKIYLPIVSLSNPITTLSDSEMGVLAQDNSVISYGGRVYVKANDTESSMEFVCADIDDVSENGSHTQSKYEITINKSTKATNVITISNYYYDKSQTDTLLGNKANKVGELPYISANLTDYVNNVITSELQGKNLLLKLGTRNFIGAIETTPMFVSYYLYEIATKNIFSATFSIQNPQFADLITSVRQTTLTSTTDVSSAIASAIATLKENSYQLVDLTEYPTEQDFLQSVGEEGYIYLYPLDTTDLTKGYHQYIWENNAWLDIGKTSVDLTQYYTKTETDALLATKANDNDVVKLTGNQSIDGVKTFNTTLSVTGNLYIAWIASQTVRPLISNYAQLGNSNYKWKDLYLGGTAYIPTIEDSSAISFKINGIERFKLNGADAITGRLYPSIGNTFDLGTNSLKYKDLYLSGGINPNTNGYKLTLPDTTNFTADSEIVDTASSQTIKSVKKFDTALGGNFKVVMNGVEKFAIYPDSDTHNTKMNVQGTTQIRFDTNQINFYKNVVPLTTNNLDLGTDDFKWRNLFLSRKLTDGTNSVTVADLANLIAYAKAQGWIQ